MIGEVSQTRNRLLVKLTPRVPKGWSERTVQLGLAVVRIGPALVLILIAAAFFAIQPLFLTERNLQNVSVQSSVVAILALGQLLVIVTRGIDLSLGAALALSTVIGAKLFDSYPGGVGILLAIMATGLIVGLINGVVYVVGRVPHPFIVTLSMLNVASGAALLISGGRANQDMPALVQTLGSSFVGPIPTPAIVVVVLTSMTAFMTRKMKWGRWIYAVGGNPEAAERTGIPLGRVLISVYAFSGLAAGCAAVIIAGRTDAGFPTAGETAALDSIAAVIIGGASFFGGRGGVLNVIIGALTIGVIRNGLNLVGVDPFWQLVAVGLIVVIAVELDVFRAHLESRIRVLQTDPDEV